MTKQLKSKSNTYKQRQINYKIIVESFVRKVSNLRIEMAQNVLRDKEVLAEATVELVTIDNVGKPKIIFEDLKVKLSSCT